MNYKVRIGGAGGTIVALTDKHYKAAGGEAAIYVNGKTAFKIFHDPKKGLIPIKKMEELAKIGNPHIVTPQEFIYDASTGDPLGYTTQFVNDAFPLARFFTRTFKDENNINPAMIGDLVKQNQEIVTDVHTARCLVVDLNELNVLVKINSGLEPWFIDTNSYATPSYRATAIMDSVRDRRVSQKQGDQLYYNPDVYSDWFSWGILSFWLYTNIHPYRGNHPDYKPKDKARQMDDGISVFHKGVRVPPSVNDFKIIPRRHLEWFKAIFLKNERSVPPLPDNSVPIAVPTAVITLASTDKISVSEVAAYSSTVTGIFYMVGTLYVLTKTHVCFGKREVALSTRTARKTALCAAPDGTIITASQCGTKVYFREMNQGSEVGTIAGNGMFARNGLVYTVANDRLVENSFEKFGSKLLHQTKQVENVSEQTSLICEGCIIQDLLGKKYLTIPYAKGRSFSKYLPQLDGFRVIEAKSEKTVTVILAERGGIYHRFIVVFDPKYLGFEVREAKDVAYDTINFTVLDSGVCILLTSPTELEMFTTARQYETLSDPPFDSTMRLFSTPDGAFFVNGNSIHQIKRK
jgi:hypothetical protein